MVEFVWPYKWSVARLLVISIAITLLALVLPKALRYVFDYVLKGRGATVFGREFQPAGLRNLIVGILASAALLQGLGTYARRMAQTFVGQRIVFDLRFTLFHHLQGLSASFYDKRSTGRVMSRILTDVDEARNLVTGVAVTTIVDCFRLVFVVAWMLQANWEMALVALAIAPFYVYTFYSYRSRLRIASIDLQARKAIVSGTLQERLSGIRVVQSFTREKTEDRRLFSQARDVFDRTLQRASLGGQLNAIATAMTGVGMASIVWFGCTKFLAGQLSSGAFVEFYALMGFLYGPLRDLSDVGETIQGALGALDRIFGLLSTPTAVEEKPGAIALPRCTGHVRFEHVSFAYRQGEAVLHDVDFEAQRGQVIAVVGPSGSGKTTLVHLILRFYDPTSGRILIDGYDIADATLFSLRQQIGIVSQDPFLFSGTIEENIGYGRKHASHEEVIAAAKAANAHEFIITLPEGYRTEVGERGVRLSGGQKQRIAIARAILRDPAILILDEATSSVDSKSENLIQSALDNLMLGRTTFIVAHRLSTIMKADVILVMEEGRIIETGRHAELLVKGGLYASLCREQFQAAPEALGIDLTSSFPHN